MNKGHLAIFPGASTLVAVSLSLCLVSREAPRRRRLSRGRRRCVCVSRESRAPAARQLSAHGALGRECAAESEMRRENVSEYTVLYTFFPYTDERLDTLVS